MAKIVQTTQSRLTRILVQFGRTIDRRDAWRGREWYASRWTAM
jgi:hypothetical protein